MDHKGDSNGSASGPSELKPVASAGAVSATGGVVTDQSESRDSGFGSVAAQDSVTVRVVGEAAAPSTQRNGSAFGSVAERSPLVPVELKAAEPVVVMPMPAVTPLQPSPPQMHAHPLQATAQVLSHIIGALSLLVTGSYYYDQKKAEAAIVDSSAWQFIYFFSPWFFAGFVGIYLWSRMLGTTVAINTSHEDFRTQVYDKVPKGYAKVWGHWAPAVTTLAVGATVAGIQAGGYNFLSTMPPLAGAVTLSTVIPATYLSAEALFFRWKRWGRSPIACAARGNNYEDGVAAQKNPWVYELTKYHYAGQIVLETYFVMLLQLMMRAIVVALAGIAAVSNAFFLPMMASASWLYVDAISHLFVYKNPIEDAVPVADLIRREPNDTDYKLHKPTAAQKSKAVCSYGTMAAIMFIFEAAIGLAFYKGEALNGDTGGTIDTNVEYDFYNRKNLWMLSFIFAATGLFAKKLMPAMFCRNRFFWHSSDTDNVFYQPLPAPAPAASSPAHAA